MKAIILILLQIILAINIYSQNNQNKKASKENRRKTTVEYKTIDYLQDTSLIYSETEKLGNRIGLKIININKKLVDINKDVQKTSFNETPPPLFETFSKTALPSSSSGESSGLSSDNKGLFTSEEIQESGLSEEIMNALSELENQYEEAAAQIIEMNNLIISFSLDYKRIKYVLQYQSDLQMLQEVCDIPFDKIKLSVNELTRNTFINDKFALEQKDKDILEAKDYINNKGVLNRYLNKFIADGDLDYSSISKTFTPGKMDLLSTKIQSVKEKIAKLKSQIQALNNQGEKVKAILNTLKEAQINFELESAEKDLKKTLENIEFDKLHLDIESFASAGKLQFFKVYDYFNQGNYTYYVNPETIDKDLIVLTVNITPKDDVPCAPLARSYEYRIRAKAGIKIDFSTGLFANVGGNQFLDQTYRYDSVPGNSTQYRIEENKSKNAFFPSIGALMHVYKRTGKDFQASGTFGISTKDLEKINYHFGGSLIFGYAQRFIVSGGVTLTKTMLLDDKYMRGQIIEKETAPETIPTSTFNRFGFFFSFTYNLTSK